MPITRLDRTTATDPAAVEWYLDQMHELAANLSTPAEAWLDLQDDDGFIYAPGASQVRFPRIHLISPRISLMVSLEYGDYEHIKIYADNPKGLHVYNLTGKPLPSIKVNVNKSAKRIASDIRSRLLPPSIEIIQQALAQYTEYIAQNLHYDRVLDELTALDPEHFKPYRTKSDNPAATDIHRSISFQPFGLIHGDAIINDYRGKITFERFEVTHELAVIILRATSEWLKSHSPESDES